MAPGWVSEFSVESLGPKPTAQAANDRAALCVIALVSSLNWTSCQRDSSCRLVRLFDSRGRHRLVSGLAVRLCLPYT